MKNKTLSLIVLALALMVSLSGCTVKKIVQVTNPVQESPQGPMVLKDKEIGWGGGCTSEGKPCDVAEGEGSNRIGSGDIAQLIRNEFHEKLMALPQLNGFIAEQSSYKDWAMEPKELNELNCVPNSIVKLKDVRIVACQDAYTIRLMKDYFGKFGHDQIAILLHETMTSYQLRNKLPPEAVRLIVRSIVSDDVTLTDLQINLWRVGIGAFYRQTDQDLMLAEIERLRPEICSGAKLSVEEIDGMTATFHSKIGQNPFAYLLNDVFSKMLANLSSMDKQKCIIFKDGLPFLFSSYWRVSEPYVR